MVLFGEFLGKKDTALKLEDLVVVRPTTLWDNHPIPEEYQKNFKGIGMDFLKCILWEDKEGSPDAIISGKRTKWGTVSVNGVFKPLFVYARHKVYMRDSPVIAPYDSRNKMKIITFMNTPHPEKVRMDTVRPDFSEFYYGYKGYSYHVTMCYSRSEG